MQRKSTKNMPSPPALARVKPLALALALAFADGANPVGAALSPDTGTPRPDGSIVWPVDNCNDAGPGSLRDAAAHANDGDGIDLTALSCSTISVSSGAITLHDVDLLGPGVNQLEIDGTGNNNRRIFNHASAGGYLDISGVTINGAKYLSNDGLGGGCLRSTGGNVRIHDAAFTNCLAITPVGADGDARGGAIAVYGNGTVELTDATISGGLAQTDHGLALGGGLFTEGFAKLVRSTIENNAASGGGGTSYALGGGVLAYGDVWIEDSTIDGNVSDSGAGGVSAKGGMLQRSTVSNNHSSFGASGIGFYGDDALSFVYSSTISGNSLAPSAQGLSGALFSDTSVTTITNSTITANSESNTAGTKFGAGIAFGPHATTVYLRGTIASGNYFDDGAPPYAADDISGPVSLTILGDTNIVGWTHITVPTDTLFEDNPRLGPLQDNGGPTRTHLPLPNSFVIGMGAAHDIDTDQRGYPRVVGATADIGAVEAGADTIFANDFE